MDHLQGKPRDPVLEYYTAIRSIPNPRSKPPLLSVVRSAEKKIAILTSQMGARHGGDTPTSPYGESKCILNDRFREIEPEWRAAGVTSAVFHPGWVATEMGGRGAPVSVDESVTGLRRVIADMTAGDSGKFLTWKGTEHPW